MARPFLIRNPVGEDAVLDFHFGSTQGGHRSGDSITPWRLRPSTQDAGGRGGICASAPQDESCQAGFDGIRAGGVDDPALAAPLSKSGKDSHAPNGGGRFASLR